MVRDDIRTSVMDKGAQRHGNHQYERIVLVAWSKPSK